jgi:hypothetical protein
VAKVKKCAFIPRERCGKVMYLTQEGRGCAIDEEGNQKDERERERE